LQALAAEGHEISLLAFAPLGEPSPSAAATVGEVCREVSCVPLVLPKVSVVRECAQAFRALFSPVPYSVLRFRSAQYRSQLCTLLKSRRFDAVLCETCYPLVNLPEHLEVPLILDNHNIEHVVVKRYRRYERNPAKRAYAELEWRKLRNWERRAWKRAAHVLLCSEHDRADCLRLSAAPRTSVVPNVVDVEQYRPEASGDGATILYTGGMDWFPNRDAVSFFAFQVMPGIRKRFPRVRFVVAGRAPDPSFRLLFKDVDVSFTGTLPDMRAAFAQAAVCVVPLRIGSGTRLKILEAAAMGKAIVSSRIGAEGLDFVSGSEILLADTAREFEGAVSKLFADAACRSSLGRSARRRVESLYSHLAMRVAIRSVLKSL
jgi:glycosyltransferase involved in cell wall biosynthesis